LSSKVPGSPGTVLSRDLLKGPVAFCGSGACGAGVCGVDGVAGAGPFVGVAPERFHSCPTMSRASLASNPYASG
jgi:hypothetical protein